MASEKAPVEQTVYDAIIIGAGISGINTAYRLQSELPSFNYTILEARGQIGGTWDLFRYPGVRSDSDLHTFGFPWRLWTKPRSIVSGEEIRTYIEESAQAYEIDRHIRFQHRVLASDWSSVRQCWNLSVEVNRCDVREIKTRFVLFSTGYYDYHSPLHAQIPEIDAFEGIRVHPQFWPTELNLVDKDVVIIGSGATAITIFPNMTDKVKSLTMLQRSPSYIMSAPTYDAVSSFLHENLPLWLSTRLIRLKFLILPVLFFRFCRMFPTKARQQLVDHMNEQLNKEIPLEPHFTPRYKPWEQRLCAALEGDFFTALREGRGQIVTDSIREVKKNGIKLESGRFLPADVLITATGLKMQFAGGTRLSMDGKPYDVKDRYLWRRHMVSDLPNAFFIFGYTTASWTLGVDHTGQAIAKLLKKMERRGLSTATPVVDSELLEGSSAMKPEDLFPLKSTYLRKAAGVLPSAGDRGPWRGCRDFFDTWWVGLTCGTTEGLKLE